MAATAKHFPGHHRVKPDPFDDPSARVPGSRTDLEPGLTPYRAVIAEGVKAVMTGPVPTDGMDPNQPSSASPIVVRALREEFGFRELIVSDDIDLPGTMRGRTLAEVAVAALSSGVELLLLAAPEADAIAMSIARGGAVWPTFPEQARAGSRRRAPPRPRLELTFPGQPRCSIPQPPVSTGRSAAPRT